MHGSFPMTALREVVLDTETTGTDPARDRIVEIGCVELVGGLETGNRFHCYINPCMRMPYSAFKVHGLSDGRLSGEPVFGGVVDGFLEFIGESSLVMHNADFDLRFLNAELRRLGRSEISSSRAIDTLVLAKQKLPCERVSLGALCRRFKIDLSGRKVHGALTDALLLVRVYSALNGGHQAALSVEVEPVGVRALPGISSDDWVPHLVQPTEAELLAHAAFVATIPGAIWGHLVP